MSELGELYRDWKKEKTAKKQLNAVASEDILIRKGVQFRKFTEDHYRVGEYNFWPSTGLFIHVHRNERGRGVFNLLKKLGVK